MPLPRLHDVTRVVTMKSDTLASVKAHFSAVVDEVHSTHQRVTVTRNGQPVAVLVSPDDLASMEETIALLSDAAELAAVADGEADARAGRVHDLDDVLADLRAAHRR